MTAVEAATSQLQVLSTACNVRVVNNAMLNDKMVETVGRFEERLVALEDWHGEERSCCASVAASHNKYIWALCRWSTAHG